MSENIVITYETLYDILRREKARPELQDLPNNFLEDLISYIKKKKEILESQESKKSIFTSIEVQKTRKQIENIEKIIKELYERRESKIIQLAIISSRTNIGTEEKRVMLPEEQELYEEIAGKLNFFRENILYELTLGNLPKVELKHYKPKDLKITEKPNKSTKSLKLLCDIPRFIGTDLETYGPFKDQETIEISPDIAELLVKQKRAEET
ncbi:DNA replication complex GINS family protein [Candidatus Woesearchaeota archaeon]|nr:DNA replication complex GINS family protein [Candidatus Woesearchaeota archaeon]